MSIKEKTRLKPFDSRFHVEGIPQRGAFPIIYLGGKFGGNLEQEAAWSRQTGCKAKCYSFAYVCKGGFQFNSGMRKIYRQDVDIGTRVMMDSSAFSFRSFVRNITAKNSRKSAGGTKALKTMEDVDRLGADTKALYIEFCREESNGWDFYVNFDVKLHQPEIYRTQRELERKGMRPVPVFHGDVGMEWLERYADDGHKLISIGSEKFRTWRMRRRFFDLLFNFGEKHGIVYHGLAITSISQMFDYPWFSVDSSTWSKVAGYGAILWPDPDNRILHMVHISKRLVNAHPSYVRMGREVQKSMKQGVEDMGFDFEKMRDELTGRMVFNAWIFMNLYDLCGKEGIRRQEKWVPLV